MPLGDAFLIKIKDFNQEIVLGNLWLNRQELRARDFSSNRGIESGGILYVFPAFDTEEWAKKIRSQPQTIYSEVP